MKRRKMNYERPEPGSFRYGEQQKWFDQVAAKLGVVCYRPDYHADSRDANTVLFYTKEDAEHNREVDRQPIHYTQSEARDRKKYSKIDIPDEYVWHDHFWSFENTDVNGHLSYDFGNYGKLDLRGSNWRDVLEGSIRFAHACKMQRMYLWATGGPLELREADETYNDWNRKKIDALRQQYGKVYLGCINYYNDKREKVAAGGDIYEEYTGGMIPSFYCGYVVPTPDQELQKLVQAWNGCNSLPAPSDIVDKIFDRVEKIGGAHLLWY